MTTHDMRPREDQTLLTDDERRDADRQPFDQDLDGRPDAWQQPATENTDEVRDGDGELRRLAVEDTTPGQGVEGGDGGRWATDDTARAEDDVPAVDVHGDRDPDPSTEPDAYAEPEQERRDPEAFGPVTDEDRTSDDATLDRELVDDPAQNVDGKHDGDAEEFLAATEAHAPAEPDVYAEPVDAQLVDAEMVDVDPVDEKAVDAEVVDSEPVVDQRHDLTSADPQPFDGQPIDVTPLDDRSSDPDPAAIDAGIAPDNVPETDSDHLTTGALAAGAAGAAVAAGAVAATKVDDAPTVDSVTGELLPTEIEPQPVAAFWNEESTADLRRRWQELQLRFIDDPSAAADEAQALVSEAVDSVTASLRAQLTAVDGHRGDQVDTEQLRIAVHRYRDLLDRVLSV
jgi:hypothetical protein